MAKRKVTKGKAKIAIREAMVPGADYAEKCRNLVELGFDGIEITTPYTLEDCAMINAATKETGIQPVLTSCGGACLVDPRKGEREAGVQMMIQHLEVCAEIGALGVIHPPLISMKMQIGGARERMPDLSPVASTMKLERDMLVALYQRICRRAEQLGTCIIIEPLNRYEQWWPCTLADGVAICKEVGSPNCKIMADFFHMHIEETDIGKAIAAAVDYIVNIHIADSTRQTPGTGLTDFRPGFKALKKGGYEHFLGLESGVPGDDRAKELKRAAKYTRDLYNRC
ncbi:MAG: sugar phosphate isomerase/epimerase [Planctomycetes bacterium]|nr:sugar phosphate isomerase/epimerase [Planctomycetota bacterium]